MDKDRDLCGRRCDPPDGSEQWPWVRAKFDDDKKALVIHALSLVEAPAGAFRAHVIIVGCRRPLAGSITRASTETSSPWWSSS